MYVCVWCVSLFEFEVSVGSCSVGWSHSIVWLMMNAGIDDFLASKSYALFITYVCRMGGALGQWGIYMPSTSHLSQVGGCGQESIQQVTSMNGSLHVRSK